MKANYHTHTVRCRHAVGDEHEYIENAIAAGKYSVFPTILRSFLKAAMFRA